MSVPRWSICRHQCFHLSVVRASRPSLVKFQVYMYVYIYIHEKNRYTILRHDRDLPDPCMGLNVFTCKDILLVLRVCKHNHVALHPTPATPFYPAHSNTSNQNHSTTNTPHRTTPHCTPPGARQHSALPNTGGQAAQCLAQPLRM